MLKINKKREWIDTTANYNNKESRLKNRKVNYRQFYPYSVLFF